MNPPTGSGTMNQKRAGIFAHPTTRRKGDYMKRLGLFVALLCLIGCQSTGQAPETETPLYYDIGVVHREITTSSPEAQLWFDRGLAMAYGFNHEEAVVCFERAAAADPDCAMCYWGKAYALGPNYNNVEMTEEASQAAHESIQTAIEKIGNTSDAERALIEALQARYTWPAPEDRTALERAYADAMRKVRADHPQDGDVAALTGEAVMMLRPWKLWTPEGEPAPETPEIRSILEAGLEQSPNHPALAHLYIHTMEAGPEAARAVAAAETLETLTPGLGHLIHMPSHIYTWTGRYDDVIRVNQRAVEVDRAFVEHAGRENFYTLYRLHNFHFVAYGAMFAGRREIAMAAAREVVAETPPTLLAAFPDFLDVFQGTPYHVMVRFGMWEEILAEPEPAAEELYAARAVWRYARGIALASLGRVDEAVEEQQAYLLARDAVPETRLLFNNPVNEILGVATEVLAGEIEYRKGNFDLAFDHLRNAVALDERLNYDEPWGWMEPARHPLGALLTEQGRYEEAIAVYEANLARYPENGWALHGLTEGLQRLGREEEAAAAQARFDAAWADSDTIIPGSCFCRTKVPQDQEQG
jgi:tetratricopeptide (TPR) repeat protein